MAGGGGCPAPRAAGDANSGEKGVGGGARIRPGPGVGDENGAPPPATGGDRSMPTGGGPTGGGPVGGGPAIGPVGGGGMACAAASCSSLSCSSHCSGVMLDGIHAPTSALYTKLGSADLGAASVR